MTFLLFSCKKSEVQDCVPSEEKEPWEKFAGAYKVYDTSNVYLYEINISHVFNGINNIGNKSDSLLIENFGGNFDYRYEFRNLIDKNGLDLFHKNPLMDLTGNNWYFWSNSDDLETPQIENYLTNDTIYLSYLLDNTPYWVEDGVPYFNCECREIAVKQN
tara:strand:+ start:271 stop:750 length:480 start_codon:yes stop_codon:yes gene_type:complete